MGTKSLLAAIVLLTAATVLADNRILGEVEFQSANKIANDSGVWVDGQYLGYVKELKGSMKVLLLPGAHDIAVRQDGYLDFRTSVTVRPGEKQVIKVKMDKDARFMMPTVFSEIKMYVNPDRAAVFLDDLFVGHAGQFGGVGRSLLVAPGHRKVTISLPGYRTFQAEVNLEPNQKIDLKTELQKEDATPTSASR